MAVVAPLPHHRTTPRLEAAEAFLAQPHLLGRTPLAMLTLLVENLGPSTVNHERLNRRAR